MDMNDILNQWEKIKRQEKSNGKKPSPQSQVSHKKPNAPSLEEKELARAIKSEKAFEKQIKEQNERHINPMEQWLRLYGTVDKDKIAEEHQETSKMANRQYLINMKPEARLDLHGMRQEEAKEHLNYFITDCDDEFEYSFLDNKWNSDYRPKYFNPEHFEYDGLKFYNDPKVLEDDRHIYEVSQFNVRINVNLSQNPKNMFVFI